MGIQLFERAFNKYVFSKYGIEKNEYIPMKNGEFIPEIAQTVDLIFFFGQKQVFRLDF